MSIIAEENFEQPLYPCAADSPSETEYSLDYLDASHPIWALAVPVYKQWVKEARESLNEVVARGPDPQGPFVDREWQFDAPKFYREHYGDYSVTEIPHDEAVRFLRELRRAASQLPAHPTAENVVRLARPFHRAGILQSNGPFPVCFEHRAYGPRRKANYYELTGHSFEPPGRVVPSLFGIACAIGSTLRELLLTAYYLGPLRRSLSRHSFYSGIRSRDVGVDGGNVPELLHDNPDLLRNVNKWLLRLGLDGPIEIRTYPTVDAIFEMRLVGNRTPRDGVNVADVGFGVSQVLPLVVQSVSQENRLLLVEQPEIHLHPALQAELADLVISGIGPKRGNQYIIETHSEHLLLRLMRRIRETSAGKSERRELRVTADQVQVLYVERRRGHSIVRQMDLNANGELTKAWPGGFFEEGLREVL